MHHRRTLERGQAIVLLVVSIVVLLGFTALAIDGGMVYSDRRKAKNASDTAALTGAAEIASRLQNADIRYQNWDCNIIEKPSAISQYAIDSAAYRSRTNGYPLDDEFGEGDGVEIICNDQDAIPVANRSVIVRTAVTAETQTSFAQILTSGPLVNYVESAAQLNAIPPFGSGMALVALNENPCSGNSNGLIFGGSSVVQISDGGAFTNCCLNGNGTHIQITTSGDGSIAYYDDDDVSCGLGPGSNVERLDYPSVAQSRYPEEYLEIPTPQCSGTGELIGEEYWPGIYTDEIRVDGTKTMRPGLYCLRATGSAMRVNNNANLTGIGVTLYIENGSVTFNGTATQTLAAPCTTLDRARLLLGPDDACPDPSPAIPYFLMIMKAGNTNAITLNGTSESVLQGSIFAIDGDVDISGNNRTWTWETQIVANNIHITGNSTLNVNFDEDRTYQFGLRISNLE
jgi:hypothetical protein